MSALRIAGIAVRELLYERVFHILICFGMLSLGVSLLLGQLTYAEQAKLTLDFMLAATQISMGLFAVFMAISLFHRELQLGSVALVLSKPVSRSSFLIGKFAGQVIVQAVVTAAMGALTLIVSLGYGLSASAAIAQTTLLTILEVTVLTAVSYFFAVNAGGITAAAAAISVGALGHLRSTELPGTAGTMEMTIWRSLRGVVPDLEVFNMKALASYGLTMSFTEVSWALTYAICCVASYLTLAAICFEQKDVLT